MIVPQDSTSSRDRIRTLLVNWLIDLELLEPSDRAWAVEQLLNEAIVGLEALDYGEVPPIFAPAKKQFWGTKPATAHRLRIEAFSHIAVLRKMGYSAEKAHNTVAGHYGISMKALEKWRKQIAQTADPDDPARWDERLAVNVYQSGVKAGRPPSEEMLLKRIARDGKAYREAVTKKETKKKGVKKKEPGKK